MRSTFSNNQRYKIVENVDFKPFPNRGSGFLFEKVTKKVTAGVTFPKIGQTFQPFFLLCFP
ncbi:Uncharacterised protein [Streptococcus suis]|nr:Uncharacterised protein [Streptococcus suis]CYV55269.1 Uncharacterised protein [Streptococcus suis]CYV75200.1 Uncharacterised protein [Streptococcus suis]CYV92334.1 Uncharacterised protein [Streptococcus suis]CYW41525.1 Uncharacterised protein [Streptococcus suis]